MWCLKTNFLLSYSFFGSGIPEELSWIKCLRMSHEVEHKILNESTVHQRLSSVIHSCDSAGRRLCAQGGLCVLITCLLASLRVSYPEPMIKVENTGLLRPGLKVTHSHFITCHSECVSKSSLHRSRGELGSIL
jgi:hypothetical protein